MVDRAHVSQSCLLSDNNWLRPLSGVNHSCALAITCYKCIAQAHSYDVYTSSDPVCENFTPDVVKPTLMNMVTISTQLEDAHTYAHSFYYIRSLSSN